MAKDHGKQIENDEKYEAIRREGASKEKGGPDRELRGSLQHVEGADQRAPKSLSGAAERPRPMALEGKSACA